MNKVKNCSHCNNPPTIEYKHAGDLSHWVVYHFCNTHPHSYMQLQDNFKTRDDAENAWNELTPSMKPEDQTNNPTPQVVGSSELVLPRYATNTEATILTIGHGIAFCLLTAYNWKFGIAYILHTLCSTWRSPMIWKRKNND